MKKNLLTRVLLFSSLTLLLSACGEKKTNEATAADNQSNDAAYEYKKFTIGQYTFETTSAREVALVDADQSITSAELSSTLSYQDVTYTLTSIGNSAFLDCSWLTSVTIPNSVKEIGCWAFSNTALYNNPANWGNGALYIDNCLIAVSKDLAGHFRIKENTRVISGGAFSYCYSLTSVTIPNSVKSIGDLAFRGCKFLTSVTIPNSVTSIGDLAFQGCSSLRSVTIPNSVTEIGSSAFEGCSGLTSITIPNSVKEIGGYAFYDCSSLTSVTIPNSVTSIGSYAFKGTALYKNPANWENRALYIDNCLIKVDEGFAGHFRIKENTRLLSSSAFSHCSSLTSVTIPNSVTSIGGGAFTLCKSLTSITIPNSVTYIGDLAFYYCSSLTSVTIPNSVKSIGEEAFNGCYSLTSVTIPNSVKEIGEEAFNGCKSLTSVTIPNSVKSIGASAFGDCWSLTSVTIPNSVKSIGKLAFSGTALYNNPANWENGALYIDNCLIKVSTDFAGHFPIKENTRVIADWAFYDCSALTSVTIPNSVTSIGGEAFWFCFSLTSVTIPNSVTKIGEKAFPSRTQIIRQ